MQTSVQTLLLENDRLKVSLSTLGGHIEEIWDKTTGGNHCWAYDSGIWPRRTSVCFPICGALPQNRYRFGGQIYSMEPHGFLRERILTVAQADARQIILCLDSNDETLAVYPFAFKLFIRYRLLEQCLRVSYEVTNPCADRPMYYSIGSHYAYRVPIAKDERAQDYVLTLPGSMTAIRCHMRDGLMDGPGEPLDLEREIPFMETVDQRSILLPCDPEASTQLVLSNPKTGNATVVAFSGFEHCVLWAPRRNAPFVCIEPWAGMTGRIGDDDIPLDKKTAIHCLAPGERRELSITISPGQPCP